MPKLPFSPIFPMGFLKVAAAGTPVDLLTAAQTAYAGAPPAGFAGLVAAYKGAQGIWPAKVNKILFAAIGASVCPGITAGGAAGAGNSGTVYFGTKQMVKGTGFGVMLPIPQPGSKIVNTYEWINNNHENFYTLENLYIDADTTGDGVFVTAWVV